MLLIGQIKLLHGSSYLALIFCVYNLTPLPPLHPKRDKNPHSDIYQRQQRPEHPEPLQLFTTVTGQVSPCIFKDMGQHLNNRMLLHQSYMVTSLEAETKTKVILEGPVFWILSW